MITTKILGDGTDTVSKMVRRFQRQPAYVMRGHAAVGFYAAKWRLPARRIATECVIDHTLACIIEGTTSIGKTLDGKTLRKPTGPGAICFLPGREGANYTIAKEITMLEIYISPPLLERFWLEHAKRGGVPRIRPLFMVDDPWLKGYFLMLSSEIEIGAGADARFDSLLLDQSQQLLFGYLLRRYADNLPALDHRRVQPRLRPHLVRRVADFVEANLSADVRLADLAALAHLSQRHFIRAFHAATGSTPYQYVLAQRLNACERRLRDDDAHPVAEIARLAGFRSHAHFTAKFRAHYGVTPTHYRRLATTR